MLKKISEQYSNGRLASETFEHTGSYLEARLQKQGVFIERTRIGACDSKPFLLSRDELSDAIELIDRWEELAITLPAFVSGGSPIGGIHSISYYPANSTDEKFSITGHEETLQYLQGDEYRRLSLKIDKAERELNEKHAGSLQRGGLRAYISRFDITLEHNKGPRCILNQAEIAGIRELAPFYRKRKKNYADAGKNNKAGNKRRI